MGDHFDISGVFETTEFEIAKSACISKTFNSKESCVNFDIISFHLKSKLESFKPSSMTSQMVSDQVRYHEDRCPHDAAHIEDGSSLSVAALP